MKTFLILWVIIFNLLSCTKVPSSPPPSYPPTTTLAGTMPSCFAGNTCPCYAMDEKPIDDNFPPIPPGQKRFELSLPQSTSAIWVEIGKQGHFYKAPERLKPTCFTVDLPPGEYQVTLHSENRDVEIGLQTGLKLYEYAKDMQPSWYHLVDFVCGGMGKCTREGLEAWAVMQRKRPHGVLDPCGSVFIRELKIDGQRSAKGDTDYQSVTLSFIMKVYKFIPYKSPGSSECKTPSKAANE